MFNLLFFTTSHHLRVAGEKRREMQMIISGFIWHFTGLWRGLINIWLNISKSRNTIHWSQSWTLIPDSLCVMNQWNYTESKFEEEDEEELELLGS